MLTTATAPDDLSWDAEDASSRLFRAFCDWERQLPDTLADATSLEKWSADTVHLSMIYVPDELRGRGWGAAILSRLGELADAHGVTLTLDPAWAGSEPQPYDLATWYIQFGFKVGSMIRDPKKTAG